jgi:hypothetical protein
MKDGRSPSQNDIFHAMMNDIAASNAEWAGQRWDADDWKALMVSAHAKATRGDHPDPRRTLIQGLEGELVQLREKTSKMSKERATSLIEYVMAWCAQHGIELKETA